MANGNLSDWLTATSTIIVAFITAVVGPYVVAWATLKWRGINPKEAAHFTNRVQFKHKIDESVALAISIADQALQSAARAEASETLIVEKNKALEVANQLLHNRVAALEKVAARVPALEAEIVHCRAARVRLRKIAAQVNRRRRK